MLRISEIEYLTLNFYNNMVMPNDAPSIVYSVPLSLENREEYMEKVYEKIKDNDLILDKDKYI